MKVSEIVAVATDNLREKYIKDHIEVEKYIPYAEKIVLAQHILDCSAYDKNGEVHFNSPMGYVFYTLTLIKNWTNIEFDDEKIMDEFDALNRLSLIEKIVGMIPESERSEFDIIYHMMLDDIQTNELSMKYVFEKALVKLGKGVGEFVQPVLEAVVAEKTN